MKRLVLPKTLVFRPFKRFLGRQQANTVWLDLRDPDLLRTYVHEILHLMHPQWSEAKTERKAITHWRKMKWRERARLARSLGRGRSE